MKDNAIAKIYSLDSLLYEHSCFSESEVMICSIDYLEFN